MSGVLVEANPALIPELERVRKQDVIINRAILARDADTSELFVSNHSELSSLSRRFVEEWQQGAVGLKEVVVVPASRMNVLLEEFFAERAPLYLSIDVEGLDLDLLKDVDWSRWRPAIVQAEPSEHFIQNNANEISHFMKSKGYVLVAKTEVNQIFMDESIRAHKKVSQISEKDDEESGRNFAALSRVGIVTAPRIAQYCCVERLKA